MSSPFILVTPATRGLSLALTRHFLRTTNLPVYATHRSQSADDVHKHMLKPISDVDPNRLTLLPLELTSESSIKSAAEQLDSHLPNDAYLHTGFFTGGILHPEKQPADIDAQKLFDSFNINVLAHLLLIKHFSRFLPSNKLNAQAQRSDRPAPSLPAKWVHVSARVGSIADNKRGGWYSYRASKAALNQVIKTFDNQLRMQRTPALCVGVHPGTVKTQLSRDFWDSAPKEELFEPADAAERVAGVVEKLSEEQRGKVWDYAGKEVPW